MDNSYPVQNYNKSHSRHGMATFSSRAEQQFIFKPPPGVSTNTQKYVLILNFTAACVFVCVCDGSACVMWFLFCLLIIGKCNIYCGGWLVSYYDISCVVVNLHCWTDPRPILGILVELLTNYHPSISSPLTKNVQNNEPAVNGWIG